MYYGDVRMKNVTLETIHKDLEYIKGNKEVYSSGKSTSANSGLSSKSDVENGIVLDFD